MVMDRVTSLADLAFRGRTDKRYRHLAVLTVSYYGKPNLSWEKAMTLLHELAISRNGNLSCANIVRDVNYNRELVIDDWQEPLEQLELHPQPQNNIISHSEWLYKDMYNYRQDDYYTYTYAQ